MKPEGGGRSDTVPCFSLVPPSASPQVAKGFSQIGLVTVMLHRAQHQLARTARLGPRSEWIVFDPPKRVGLLRDATILWRA